MNNVMTNARCCFNVKLVFFMFVLCAAVVWLSHEKTFNICRHVPQTRAAASAN
jgi:hypothetical protein